MIKKAGFRAFDYNEWSREVVEVIEVVEVVEGGRGRKEEMGS